MTGWLRCDLFGYFVHHLVVGHPQYNQIAVSGTRLKQSWYTKSLGDYKSVQISRTKVSFNDTGEKV